MVSRRSQQGSSAPQTGRASTPPMGESEGTPRVTGRALHLSPHRAAGRHEGVQPWPVETPQYAGLAGGGRGAFRGSVQWWPREGNSRREECLTTSPGACLEVCHPSACMSRSRGSAAQGPRHRGEGRAERWGRRRGRNSKTQSWQEVPEIWSWETLMLPSTGPWAPWRLQEINWLTTNCHMYPWLFQQILCEIQANEAQDLSLRRSPSNGLKENNFRTSVVKKKKKKKKRTSVIKKEEMQFVLWCYPRWKTM